MKTRIVISFLLCSSLAQAQSFATKTNALHLDNSQPALATTLPEIVWTTPKIESSVSSAESIMLELTIQSDVPLKEIRLVVVAGGENREKKLKVQEGELSYSIKQPLQLQNGDNTIKLVVENVKGGTVSSSRSILMGKDAIADAVDVNRKDYALIVAT